MAQTPGATEIRGIVRQAYIYGFPLVDSYRIQHSFFVDTAGSQFKAPANTLVSNARVFTPEDTSVQTPNSDTPYSFLGADLRAEPLVLTVPEVPDGRYYSLQFIDLLTHNFAYVGTRATGNKAGRYLLAGPGWAGEKPAGIAAVIRCETDLCFVFYRTQLIGPADIEAVKAIQAGYRVQPLSAFLGVPPPPSAPPIDYPAPLTPETQRTSPAFFDVLNFVLQFCPPHPSETALLAEFARAGIGPGLKMASVIDSAEKRQAVLDGMADAWGEFGAFKAQEIDTGKKGSADCFGTRAFLNGSNILRMAGAVLGIYGNSREEALYPLYLVDSAGRPLSGERGYVLRFPPGQLPPVDAFWSLTLYALPASLLFANPLNRYLINSPMLPDLALDADGGLTLHIGHASPGPKWEANWLPAPEGPFFCALRLYLPKAEAQDGRWTAPKMCAVG